MASQIAILRICYFVLLCHHLSTAQTPDDDYLNYLQRVLSHATDAYHRALVNEEDLWSPAPRPDDMPWWGQALVLGQICGVTVNKAGQPIVFHRGPRVWDERSFNGTNIFQQRSEGPIREDTVLVLHPETAKVLDKWGKDMFYLPHGITADHDGNVWLTDVALHQVFKFAPGSQLPQLTFGQRFVPGSAVFQLCKPTSVAVASTGEIFIADGYCNARILKFDEEGNFMRTFPQKQEFLSLQVPHSLALLEHRDILCIADRDDMRVACIGAKLRDHGPRPGPVFTIQEPDLGRVYGIASHGDLVYAVNGYTSPMIPVQGFTLDPLAETIVDHWGPSYQKFQNPHDIAITPDGKFLYVTEIGPNRIWKFKLNPHVPSPRSINKIKRL